MTRGQLKRPAAVSVRMEDNAEAIDEGHKNDHRFLTKIPAIKSKYLKKNCPDTITLTMNDPITYRQWNPLRVNESEILQKYSKMINWRTDQFDSLIDIGCAGGDVTNDLVLPLLPEKFTRVIGVDVSETMVRFANENYANSKVSFEKLDIGDEISEFLNRHEPFDHVVSLLCLHLIPDQKTALKNIQKLLTPSGDCLLYIIAEQRLFDMYYDLHGKWKKYLPKVDNFISPYYHRVNPVEMLTDLLESVGFQSPFVEMVKTTINYTDGNLYKIATRTFMPFISNVPAELQDEFADDMLKLAISYNRKDMPEGVSVEMPFECLIAYARKGDH